MEKGYTTRSRYIIVLLTYQLDLPRVERPLS